MHILISESRIIPCGLLKLTTLYDQRRGRRGMEKSIPPPPAKKWGRCRESGFINIIRALTSFPHSPRRTATNHVPGNTSIRVSTQTDRQTTRIGKNDPPCYVAIHTQRTTRLPHSLLCRRKLRIAVTSSPTRGSMNEEYSSEVCSSPLGFYSKEKVQFIGANQKFADVSGGWK